MPTDPDPLLAQRLAAGWYPDDESGGERWWNGTQWTTHTRSDGGTANLTALEGESPRAWSTAGDGLLVTVDDPYPPTAYQPTYQPPTVPPGWYPDPQGMVTQRWWDGMAWTDQLAPLPAPPALLVPGKSVGVALVLTFFFGPLGMLYSTVFGAMVMLIVLFVAGWLVFGPFWLLFWPLAWAGSMVWGALAAAKSPPRLVHPSTRR